MCACGVTAVALVNKHNIEMISSFHTACFCETVFTCLFVGVCVCVCLSYPVSVEFSSVYYGLVKKLCCMPKFVFARLFVPLGCPTTELRHFEQNPAYVAFFWDYGFVFFVRITSGIIASVIRQTASHPLALFSSSLCMFVTLAILSFKRIFIIIIDIIIN